MAQKNAQPVTATEHIPASEHGGGFPPFQKETFASQLLWLALVFVALYLLMSRIALPRIGSILDRRRSRGAAGRRRCRPRAQALRGKNVRSRILGGSGLRDLRGRADLLPRAQDGDRRHRRAPRSHPGRTRRGPPPQGGGAGAART